MYAVMGATGQVGGTVVEELIAAGVPVRAVVRTEARGEALIKKGAEIMVAEATDVEALTEAFAGAKAAFVLNPPAFDQPDMFDVCATVCAVLRTVIEKSEVPAVVVLSSIGAHLPAGTGNIRTDHMLEMALRDSAPRVAVVRGAWFMENWGGMVEPATADGVLPSMLTPLDRAIPQVSAVDMGRVCAQAMLEGPVGTEIIEVEGPREYGPVDVADAFSTVLGKTVAAVPVPEEQWEGIFLGMGNSPRNALAWVELIQSINAGRLAFEGGHKHVAGTQAMDAVVRHLVGATE